MGIKREHSLEEIESELLFDRDVSGESATGRLQREGLERACKGLLGLADTFDKLGAAAVKKVLEFKEEFARLKLDAELDELEGSDDA